MNNLHRPKYSEDELCTAVEHENFSPLFVPLGKENGMSHKTTLADTITAFLGCSKSWTATVLACIIFVPLIAYLHLRYFFRHSIAKPSTAARVYTQGSISTPKRLHGTRQSLSTSAMN